MSGIVYAVRHRFDYFLPNCGEYQRLYGYLNKIEFRAKMIEKKNEHFKMWRKPRMKLLRIWRSEIEQWVEL